jgi:subtilisin family serine protease
MSEKLGLAFGLALAALVFTPAGPAQAASAAAETPQPRVVVLAAGVGDVDATVQVFERRNGVRAGHTYRSALKGFAARLTEAQRAALLRDARVVAVVDDITFTANGQAALAGGESVPAGIRRIRAGSTTTAAGPGAPVAVLDTGIDLKSGDLDARHGVNCVSSTAPAQDDHGHGTHVAGTIAARNGGTGVVGVAPGTTMYSVKVLNARKTGTLSQVLCGIDWVTRNAAALGIRVANMSLSAAGSDDGRCGEVDRDVQHQAICRSVAAGVTYVAATGNAGRDMATTVPAAYREVLAVSAANDADGLPGAKATQFACKTTERDDRAATYANFATTPAAQAHLVAAPGTCVVSTKLGGGTTGDDRHEHGLAARCRGGLACAVAADRVPVWPQRAWWTVCGRSRPKPHLAAGSRETRCRRWPAAIYGHLVDAASL